MRQGRGSVHDLPHIIIIRVESKSNCIALIRKVFFGEPDGDKIVQKGVYTKMARGEMERFKGPKVPLKRSLFIS